MQNMDLVLIQDLGMLFPSEASNRKVRYGLYKCFCGNEFKTSIQRAKHGYTISCGCYKNTKLRIHGMTKHRLYNVWNCMMQRCNNPKNTNYKHYGERGIKVCDEWLDINNFINDMDDLYVKGLTLDRIDVDGNYEPSNCRWTTMTVQHRNTRLLNSKNTSGYRGVSFDKSRNKFEAYIYINKKRKRLGRFTNALESAYAYDDYVIKNNLENPLNLKKRSR